MAAIRIPSIKTFEKLSPLPEVEPYKRTRFLLVKWSAFRKKNEKQEKITSISLNNFKSIDFENRFNNKEKIWSTLVQYVPAYGEEAAQTRLNSISKQLANIEPDTVFRYLVKRIGKDADKILNWIQAYFVHVDSHVLMIKDLNEERVLQPLETIFIGLGQCACFAKVAAVLLYVAGYSVRLCGVAGHTYLEYKNKSGRWQLADVDSIPAGQKLPIGMSLESLLENYEDWAPILGAIPRYNNIRLQDCLVPTEEDGKIYRWLEYIPKYGEIAYSYADWVGGVKRRKINYSCRINIAKDEMSYSVEVMDKIAEPFVMALCFSLEFLLEDKKGIGGAQHDVFFSKNIKQVVDYTINSADEIIYCQILPSEILINVKPKVKAKWLSILIYPESQVTAFPFVSLFKYPLPPLPSLKANEAGIQSNLLYAEDKSGSSCKSLFIKSEDRDGVANSISQELENMGVEKKDLYFDQRYESPKTSLVLRNFSNIKTITDTHQEETIFLDMLIGDEMISTQKLRFDENFLKNLPYLNDYFDNIFCLSQVFSINLKAFITELYRILRLDGKVFLQVHSSGYYLGQLDEHKLNEESARKVARDILYNTVWQHHGENFRKSILGYYETIRNIFQVNKFSTSKSLKKLSMNDLFDLYFKILNISTDQDRKQIRKLELQARHLCGENHLKTIMIDILSISACFSMNHSSSSFLVAVNPLELEPVIINAGFQQFSWARYRQKFSDNSHVLFSDSCTSMLQRDNWHSKQAHFRSQLSTWNCSFKKCSVT